MTDLSHFSIGEVLSALKDDFPDVTISKIRFLEAQGLIEPERTSSGYRKFYAPDVERLRWILQQQREHFLPLKVIRGRLSGEEVEHDGFETDEFGNNQGSFVLSSGDPAPEFEPNPVMKELNAGSQVRAEAEPTRNAPVMKQTFETNLGKLQKSLTREDLLKTSGITEIELREYEEAGLIRPSVFGGEASYGTNAQRIAFLGGSFANHGLHARHLRVLKTGADRQAGLIEQVASPLLRHNTEKAQLALHETVNELINLTMALQLELLVNSLGTLVVREGSEVDNESEQ